MTSHSKDSVSVYPIGRLANGGQAAPIEAAHAAPRCGARTRAGTPCKRAAVRGGTRCPLHGGRSTGPRTPEGRERARLANYRHGQRTREAIAERKRRAAALRAARKMLAKLTKGETPTLEDVWPLLSKGE
jgi:hypothetical protein